MRSPGKTHSVSSASRAGRGGMEAARTRSARTVDRAIEKKTFAQTRATANREKALARANTQRTNRMETARTRGARNANRAKAGETFAGNESTVNRQRGVAGANSVRSNGAKAARIDNARAMQANVARAAAGNLAVNQKRNLSFARNVALNRDRNVRIVNYWRNDRFRGGDYVAFYNYNRVWHDRAWWVSYYPNITFVLGDGGTGPLVAGTRLGATTRTAGIRLTDRFTLAMPSGRRTGSLKTCNSRCNSKAITPERSMDA